MPIATAPEPSQAVTTCPFCRSTKVTTTSQKADAANYWRCEACGESGTPGGCRNRRTGSLRDPAGRDAPRTAPCLDDIRWRTAARSIPAHRLLETIRRQEDLRTMSPLGAGCRSRPRRLRSGRQTREVCPHCQRTTAQIFSRSELCFCRVPVLR